MFSSIHELHELCEDLRLSASSAKEQQEFLAAALEDLLEAIENDGQEPPLEEAIQSAKNALAYVKF